MSAFWNLARQAQQGAESSPPVTGPAPDHEAARAAEPLAPIGEEATPQVAAAQTMGAAAPDAGAPSIAPDPIDHADRSADSRESGPEPSEESSETWAEDEWSEDEPDEDDAPPPRSDHAKQRLMLFLQTMAGQCTVDEACQKLGICASRFYEQRAAWLHGALHLLEPRTPGRSRRQEPAASPEGE